MNWRKAVLLPAIRLTRKTVHRELNLLRTLEHKSASEITALHEARLEQLLRHAYRHTEYYRDVLSACGAVRDGVVDLSRFEDIPILTKDIIRRQGPRLRARTLPRGRKAYVNRTGGSTGEPIEYWQDNYYWDVNVATKIYHFEIFGKQLGDPELKLWGSERDIVRETSTWQARLQNFLYNRRIRTCARLAEQDIRTIVGEVNRYKPRSIWGYIDGLYTVARYINQHGLEVHPPKAVFGGGGTLFPQMAEAIRTAFGAPVVNSYGSREMGDVACECPRTAGLHVSSNSHRVEVLDASGSSVVEQEGALILTSLHNYAMPFIRYSIGDRGRLTRQPCPCGRGFPLLESVAGRGMESFVTRDGAIVSSIYLITAIDTLGDTNLVRRIQFVQDDYSHLIVRTVVHERADEAALTRQLEEVARKIRSVMGTDCRVSFDRVAEIPPTASGKYLYTVSKVQPRPEAEAHVA